MIWNEQVASVTTHEWTNSGVSEWILMHFYKLRQDSNQNQNPIFLLCLKHPWLDWEHGLCTTAHLSHQLWQQTHTFLSAKLFFRENNIVGFKMRPVRQTTNLWVHFLNCKLIRGEPRVQRDWERDFCLEGIIYSFNSFNYRMKCTRMIWKKMINSSYSAKSP